MDTTVYLIRTEQGFLAGHGDQRYTDDPDDAVSFVDIDVAAERAKEMTYLFNARCTLHIHSQRFPRPTSPKSHGTTKQQDPSDG